MNACEVDPVRLEVIRNSLIAAADAMNASIWRTARSTVGRATVDHSKPFFSGDGPGVS